MAKKRKAKKKVAKAKKRAAPARRKKVAARKRRARRKQASGASRSQAKAPRGEDQAAAAIRRADGAAADERARSRGHADRAAAVAVPVIGAGRFPDQLAGRQELALSSFRGIREAREPGIQRHALLSFRNPGSRLRRDRNDSARRATAYSAATVCACCWTWRLTSASGVAVCSSMPQLFSQS